MASSFLETAADIAREAGSLINLFLERRIGYELKAEYDLVTEADRSSERLIVQRLLSEFPTHAIVAEEGGGQAGSRNTAGTSIRSTAPPTSRTAFRCST